MGKVTFLDELERRWFDQAKALGKHVFVAAGKPDQVRWNQIIAAHRRRAYRNNGATRTNRSSRVANELSNIELFSTAVRGNRKLSGMPPQVVTVRNGKIHSWSD